MKFVFCVLSQEVNLWLWNLYWLNAFFLYELADQRSWHLNFSSQRTSFAFDCIPTHPHMHGYEWKWTWSPVWAHINTHSHILHHATWDFHSFTKFTVSIFAKLMTQYFSEQKIRIFNTFQFYNCIYYSGIWVTWLWLVNCDILWSAIAV